MGENGQTVHRPGSGPSNVGALELADARLVIGEALPSGVELLPGNAMQRMNIPQQDARDILAVVYALK